VQLLFQLGVRDVRPRETISDFLDLGLKMGEAYWTPPGCRAVLLTVWESILRRSVPDVKIFVFG
jgi:hypothetical protein